MGTQLARDLSVVNQRKLRLDAVLLDQSPICTNHRSGRPKYKFARSYALLQISCCLATGLNTLGGCILLSQHICREQ